MTYKIQLFSDEQSTSTSVENHELPSLECKTLDRTPVISK